MAPSYRIGQRLSFDGALCTVRYVGPVAGTQKDWLGVEWDDPSRGKHDGEHQGVRYFTCGRISKTSASFIRPSRKPDPPRTFLEAVHLKYASEFDERQSGQVVDKEIEISGKVVYEVGFDKIRAQLAQLDELKIVLVDGLRIDSALTPGKSVKQVCPKIVDLDLSRNLFESCKEIIQICGELDYLKSLRLNGNRLSVIPEEFLPEATPLAFEGVRDLGLDETLLSWDCISQLAQQFSNLTKLSVSSNDLSTIPRSISSSALPAGLKSLTLEYNLFKSVSDLSPLTKLMSLETLHVKGNQIKSIDSLVEDSKFNFGKQLRYVDLSYNEVTSWDFVDALPDVFPGMTGLRLSNNPIYEPVLKRGNTAMSAEEGYMFILARIANLTSLNFSNITTADRTNAEMFYLSRIGKSMAEVAENEEWKIIAQHRRFHELCDIYGAPTVVRVGKTIDPNFLEARLITFTFYIPANTLPEQTEEIKMVQQIPKGFDTYRMKGIVGKLFGLRPMGLRLIWETGEWDPVAGYLEEESDGSDEEKEADGTDETGKKRGKWTKREVEIEDGTRQIGFRVDGMEARVRVEVREGSM